MTSEAADQMARALAALANPVRLDILRELRTPRRLGEIRVTVDENGARRPISRQAVSQHIEKLAEVGAVVCVDGEGGGRAVYVVDQLKLFALSEEFRSIAALRPDEHRAVETLVVGPTPRQRSRPGSRLVLVRGLNEGRVFSLDSEPRAEGPWLIGRRRDADIPLDYDPFVSNENALIRRLASGALTVEDVNGSRNGTMLNSQPLASGQASALRHGDLIVIGRSALLYREG